MKREKDATSEIEIDRKTQGMIKELLSVKMEADERIRCILSVYANVHGIDGVVMLSGDGTKIIKK